MHGKVHKQYYKLNGAQYATSKAKIEVISRVWSSCLQGSQSCRKLDPHKRTQQVRRSRTRLPALPTARTQAKEPQSIMGNSQAT